MDAQVKIVNFRWLKGGNPGFQPGESQVAVIEMLNPTASILPYTAELYLDKPEVAGSGKVFFNISAGQVKTVNFPVIMPDVKGTYPVHLDIFSNDQLVGAYKAAEDVQIITPYPSIAEITAYGINWGAGVSQWYCDIYDPSAGYSDNYRQKPVNGYGRAWRKPSAPCSFNMPRPESGVSWEPGTTNLWVFATVGELTTRIYGSLKLKVWPGCVIIFDYSTGSVKIT